jgi:DNA polymerase sigma
MPVPTPEGVKFAIQLTSAFPDYVSKVPVPVTVSLPTQLQSYLAQNEFTDAEAKTRAAAVKAVRDLLSKCSDGALTTASYGSSGMNIDCKGSDIDLVVVSAKTGLPSDSALTALTAMTKALGRSKAAKAGLTLDLSLLRKRVPLLVLKYKGVDIDLVVPSVVDVKAKLIRSYCALSPLVRPLLLLAKLWAKQQDLIDASAHKLNSWTVVLLVIQYLQICHRLPVLQPSSPLSPAYSAYARAHAADFASHRPASILRVLPGTLPSKPGAAVTLPAAWPSSVDPIYTHGGLRVGPAAASAYSSLPPALRADITDPATLPASVIPSLPALDVLVTGFFRFYSSFDFNTYAISVRLGHCIWNDPTKRAAALSTKATSSSGKPSVIFVEDPFDPADSASRALSADYAKVFIKHVKATCAQLSAPVPDWTAAVTGAPDMKFVWHHDMFMQHRVNAMPSNTQRYAAWVKAADALGWSEGLRAWYKARASGGRVEKPKRVKCGFANPPPRVEEEEEAKAVDEGVLEEQSEVYREEAGEPVRIVKEKATFGRGFAGLMDDDEDEDEDDAVDTSADLFSADGEGDDEDMSMDDDEDELEIDVTDVEEEDGIYEEEEDMEMSGDEVPEEEDDTETEVNAKAETDDGDYDLVMKDDHACVPDAETVPEAMVDSDNEAEVPVAVAA